jgi:mannosylfructose-phosphate synthase
MSSGELRADAVWSPAEAQILESCEQLTRELGLAARVVVSGFVPEADMPGLYRAADVFVLCSRYEPLGMTDRRDRS